MNLRNRILATALALTVSLSCFSLLSVSSSANEDSPVSPELVITEVCFNPTFQSNSFGLGNGADVLEYVEIANRSDKAVSLTDATLRRSNKGYEGSFKSNCILPVADGGAAALQPGEIAVIVIYNADAFQAGLGYRTEADRRAYYKLFTDFHKCADTLSEDRFFIAPGYSQETGEQLPGGFHLTNDAEHVVLRLVDAAENTVCEAAYNAAEWNRNQYAVNFTYRLGADPAHPLATQPLNMGCTTPGVLRDNQLSTEGMTPSGLTTALKVMEYNICATASTQKKPGGAAVTLQDRMAHLRTVLQSENPDVIGLCEVNYMWLDGLSKDVTGDDDEYDAYGRSSQGNTYGKAFTEIGDKTWDLFNLILWRRDKYDMVKKGTFWCSTRPNSVGSFQWLGGITGDFARAINWVILKEKATGAEFFFLCAHIDAKVEDARNKSAKLIINQATELSEGRPIVMVGDWNAKESKEAYRILTGEGFADARYRVADPTKMTLYGTGNASDGMWGMNLNPKNVIAIDHCIITPHNVFVQAATCDLGLLQDSDTFVASDHNAILFDLALQYPLAEETENGNGSETGAGSDSQTTAIETEQQAQAGCGASLIGSALVFSSLIAVTLFTKKRG